MQFEMTEEAAERLGLDPGKVCRTFDGPSTREGLMGGFPRGVLGWIKKALRVDRIDQLDLQESRLAYYLLTMRSTDHRALPVERFDDLALTDFRLVKHYVTSRDQDGDCGECNMPIDLWSVHFEPEVGAGDVPPTTAPDGPGTTETATE